MKTAGAPGNVAQVTKSEKHRNHQKGGPFKSNNSANRFKTVLRTTTGTKLNQIAANKPLQPTPKSGAAELVVSVLK